MRGGLGGEQEREESGRRVTLTEIPALSHNPAAGQPAVLENDAVEFEVAHSSATLARKAVNIRLVGVQVRLGGLGRGARGDWTEGAAARATDGMELQQGGIAVDYGGLGHGSAWLQPRTQLTPMSAGLRAGWEGRREAWHAGAQRARAAAPRR